MPMQLPAQSEPPQQTEPWMHADGQADSHVPATQLMLPVPQGSGPQRSPGRQGQFTVPSVQSSTNSHQFP